MGAKVQELQPAEAFFILNERENKNHRIRRPSSNVRPTLQTYLLKCWYDSLNNSMPGRNKFLPGILIAKNLEVKIQAEFEKGDIVAQLTPDTNRGGEIVLGPNEYAGYGIYIAGVVRNTIFVEVGI